MNQLTATSWLDAVGSGLGVTKITKDQVKKNDSRQSARLSMAPPDAVAHGMAIAKAFAVSANLVDFAKAFAAANPSYVPGNIATEDGSRSFWSHFDAIEDVQVTLPLVHHATQDGNPSCSFPEV